MGLDKYEYMPDKYARRQQFMEDELSLWRGMWSKQVLMLVGMERLSTHSCGRGAVKYSSMWIWCLDDKLSHFQLVNWAKWI